MKGECWEQVKEGDTGYAFALIMLRFSLVYRDSSLNVFRAGVLDQMLTIVGVKDVVIKPIPSCLLA